MSQVMVRYKVKPEQAARNEELVRGVYEELQRTIPAGLHYATFVLEDGVSFVHVSATDTENGRNPLTELPAFQRFLEGVVERCAEPPAAVSLRQIGSYRFWADQDGA